MGLFVTPTQYKRHYKKKAPAKFVGSYPVNGGMQRGILLTRATAEAAGIEDGVELFDISETWVDLQGVIADTAVMKEEEVAYIHERALKRRKVNVNPKTLQGTTGVLLNKSSVCRRTSSTMIMTTCGAVQLISGTR